MQNISLSLEAVAAQKTKHTLAITGLRIWMGGQNMFLISNGYPEEITSED